MPKKVILRADGSPALGMGHLNRVMALGQEFAARGWTTHIFARCADMGMASKVQQLFASQGIAIELLSNEERFIEILKTLKPELLLVDLVENDAYAGLREYLRSKPFAVACFDDFYSAELGMNPVIQPFHRNEDLSSGKILSGLQYFIFRSELMEARRESQRRQAFPPQKILISMGGSDPSDSTAKVAECLVPFRPDLEFRIVVGPGFSDKNRERLEALARTHSHIRLERTPEQMSDLYQSCDFMFVSGGITKFEAALFGVPSLMVAQNAQEDELAERFERMGSTRYLGLARELSCERVQNEFSKLLVDERTLRSMSQRGQEILDTEGGRRVLDYIEARVR